jgi:hypothetical protein
VRTSTRAYLEPRVLFLLLAALVGSAAGVAAAAEHDATALTIAAALVLTASWFALVAWILLRDRELARRGPSPSVDWPRFERSFWEHVATTSDAE